MAEKEIKEIKKSDVPFTSEQMSIIQSMLEQARNSASNRTVDSVSMYNLRDPKSIETVNVNRIDGKFVVGFVNHQKDSFKKKPQYLVYKPFVHATGLLQKEPYVTLILSEDGETFEEKEMALVDYMAEKDKIKCKVLNIDVKKIVEDHGVLGSSGEFAVAVDSKGLPEARPTILAQTEHEVRVFTVELEGFKKPYDFISDFLG